MGDLEEVSLGAATLTNVVGLVASGPTGPDQLALARIEREWGQALRKYRQDRDTEALERTMKRLDDQEAEANRPRDEEGVPADVAVRYLRELPETWRRADGGPGRRMLAEALFERVEALGFQEATLRLTDAAIAHGFASVIPDRLDLGIVGNGRGERSRADTFQISVSVLDGDGERIDSRSSDVA